MDPGGRMSPCFQGPGPQDHYSLTRVREEGRVTGSLPCWQPSSVLWNVVCFEFKVLPAKQSSQMQLQVSGGKIQEQEGPACPGKLHLKFLGMASNEGKCDKPLGSLKQWSAKCGPWTSSMSMTWELVRNADSQAAPQIY